MASGASSFEAADDADDIFKVLVDFVDKDLPLPKRCRAWSWRVLPTQCATCLEARPRAVRRTWQRPPRTDLRGGDMAWVIDAESARFAASAANREGICRWARAHRMGAKSRSSG